MKVRNKLTGERYSSIRAFSDRRRWTASGENRTEVRHPINIRYARHLLAIIDLGLHNRSLSESDTSLVVKVALYATCINQGTIVV